MADIGDVQEDQEEEEQEEEEEQSSSNSEVVPRDPRLKYLLEKFTPEAIDTLIGMAKNTQAKDSCEMVHLKGVAPDFKGDFVNFVLKDSIYTEMISEAPDFTMRFEAVPIGPLKKVLPKDAAEVRAMDENLTLISQNLQVAIKYLVHGLSATDRHTDEAVSDGLFCGLCLTAHAFSALQVERHTTAALRSRIVEATAGSQVPTVVQKVKKSFFRPGGGGAEAPPPEEEEEDDEEDLARMRRKRRDRKRWFTSSSTPHRLAEFRRPKPKFYRPYSPGRPARPPFRGRERRRGRGNGRGRGRAADPP
jgi:hypothetical protein